MALWTSPAEFFRTSAIGSSIRFRARPGRTVAGMIGPPGAGYSGRWFGSACALAGRFQLSKALKCWCQGRTIGVGLLSHWFRLHVPTELRATQRIPDALLDTVRLSRLSAQESRGLAPRLLAAPPPMASGKMTRSEIRKLLLERTSHRTPPNPVYSSSPRPSRICGMHFSTLASRVSLFFAPEK